MRARWKLILGIVIAASRADGAAAILLGWQPTATIRYLSSRAEPAIRLGLLHSQTGTLAISEKSLLDAEMLAIEEINAEGGVAGRQIVWDSPDCRSDAERVRHRGAPPDRAARRRSLFGCWTSECRKAVLPVVDELSSLLFFPGNFEGIERSPESSTRADRPTSR